METIETLRARIAELENTIAVLNGKNPERIAQQVALTEARDQGFVKCTIPTDAQLYDSCADLKVPESDPISVKIPGAKLCRCKICDVKCAFTEKIVINDEESTNESLNKRVSTLESHAKGNANAWAKTMSKYYEDDAAERNAIKTVTLGSSR